MNFQTLTTQYTGATAKVYEDRRAATPKWRSEQRAFRELLSDLPAGASVIDIPVGTGRFLELYRQRGLKVAGRDISPDMLRIAENKLRQIGPLDCSLALADIRNIPEPNDRFDCAVCIRFLNWVDLRGFEDALRELRRVSKRHLIVGVRHQVPAIELLLDGPKGVLRLAMRYALKLRPKKGPQTTVHAKEAVHRTFRRLGLRIEAMKLVEQGRDGTEYCFYRLSKRDA